MLPSSKIRSCKNAIRHALPSASRWPAIWVVTFVASACVMPALGNPLSVLNDEFEDGSSISDWARIHEVEGWNADHANIWDIDATQPGRMVIEPLTTSWYQDYRGILAYKEVSGDFAITSQVHVTDRDLLDDNEVPFPSYSLAGLMIRRPRAITNPAVDWSPGDKTIGNPPNGENYVFLSIGQADNVGGSEFQFEVKNTRNSNSQLEISTAPGNLITIQLVRIGDSVLTLYQEPGEDWVVHRRYDRADLPETLQVGMVAYTEWDLIWPNFTPFEHNSNVLLNPPYGFDFQPDLTAGFEYARFYEPTVPAELAGINLFDQGQVSDEQLLIFLGDIANQAVADADFDQDADVDGGDFLSWQRQFGLSSGASPSMGDADFDQDIDQDDLFAWQQQFGGSVNVAPVAVTIPEPATFSLVLLAGLLALFSHQWRIGSRSFTQ